MLIAACLALASLDVNVASGSGMSASFEGIPIVRGSWFQYYERGWTRGYYSSNWNPQDVKAVDGGFDLTFRSEDGQAHGTQTFRRTEEGVQARYEFHWEGDNPVLIELTGGMLWTAPWEHGRLYIDGREARSLAARDYSGESFESRRYGADASHFRFESDFGTLEFKSPQRGWTVFDARGHNQEWAMGRDLFWLGMPGIEVAKGRPAIIELEMIFRGRAVAPGSGQVVAVPPTRLEVARSVGEPPPLIPQPKEIRFGDGSLPLGRQPYLRGTRGFDREFFDTVENWWAGPLGVGPSLAIMTEIRDIGLPAEGYRITVNAGGVWVVGQDSGGLRMGLRTLAKLVRAERGRLVLPFVEIDDWPTLSWRGVHLFVGPTALELHQRLFSRALLPLGYNHVVLQCERTDWRAVPGIRTSMTMPREDLRREFEWMRSRGVEPIPLIQSFGHVGWLFANNQNLDIAFNREIPFSVDPRKPRTREVLTAIWDEAIELLRPNTIHWGLDEVDMRGFPPGDYELVSQLWEMHLPFLTELARRHNVTPMLWGDKMLAPGEAIDATHGHTPDHALRRRLALPRGAMVADWHYRAQENPERFRDSLRLWKETGNPPIASAWFRLENVRGFSQAAIDENVGYLQTTWAGYESNEANLLREFRQFSAMVVAGDFIWSGRPNRIRDLGYDPFDVMGRLLYGQPELAAPAPGWALTQGEARTVAGVGFRMADPMPLWLQLDADTAQAPREITFTAGQRARWVAVALDCQNRADDGELVAHLTIRTPRKSDRTDLRYGWHVRTQTDRSGIIFGRRQGGLSVLLIPVEEQVESITVEAANGHTGLRVYGVTLVE